MKIRASFSLFSLFLLVTHAVPSLADSSGNATVDPGATMGEETRIYYGTCLFNEVKTSTVTSHEKGNVPAVNPTFNVRNFTAIGPIPAAIADVVIDYSAAALKAAATTETAQSVVAYPAHGSFYQQTSDGKLGLNTKSQCIQVISGSFYNGTRAYATDPDRKPDGDIVLSDTATTIPGDSIAKDNQPLVRLSAGKDHVIPVLNQRFRQANKIRIFFEARIVSVDDQLFSISPSALIYMEPADPGFFHDMIHPARNVLVSLTLAPTGTVDGKTISSVSFPFPELKPKTFLTPLYFAGQASSGFHAPTLSDDDKTSVTSLQKELKDANSEWSLVEKPKDSKPKTKKLEDDADYKNALTDYCKEVTIANHKALEEHRARLTVDQCPEALGKAKQALADAEANFSQKTALDKANKDIVAWKKAKTPGLDVAADPIDSFPDVVCDPADEKKGAHCTLADSATYLPVTVSASVVEVRKPNEFIAFLGKVADAVAPTAKQAIDSRTKAAQETKEEAQNSALDDYASSYATAKAAQSKWSATTDGPDKDAAWADFVTKAADANAKARKAGKAEPFPNIYAGL